MRRWYTATGRPSARRRLGETERIADEWIQVTPVVQGALKSADRKHIRLTSSQVTMDRMPTVAM